MNKAKNNTRTLKLLLCGCATGIACGVVISLFLVCARIVISFAFGMYRNANFALAIVCVIFLVLTCCLIMAVLQTLVPSSRGSGIPLAEGCARGILKVKWLRTAAALIAGSLLSFLSGMPLGSEGPSIGVGGLIGDGIGKAANKSASSEFRRYLITGGSSAGLAVAFNAPLTGVAFALEETHRRFSPNILLAAFSAVIPAILTSQLLYWGLGQSAYLHSIGVREGFTVLPFLAQTAYGSVGAFFSVCLIAVICGALCAALGVAFNRVIALLGKLFSRIKSNALRLLPAFVLTLVCGLILYKTIGSGEAMLDGVIEHPVLWLMFVLLLVRFVITAVASGSGATGGLFIPMIAIGGLIGAIAADVSKRCGLDSTYAPNVIMLCVSAYFAASVRAPISAIAMSVELTASFANLLPCAIAVAVATAVAGITRTEPLYERMMRDLQHNASLPVTAKNLTVRGVIAENSMISGKLIRDILWPYNALVTELERGDRDIVPDGETELMDGDILTVRAELVDPQYFMETITDYIKLIDSETCKQQSE
ncbi:MAG: chloride channel protein [Clostridiales bacterium]|nr:chloride channel protein [Clostridiales bacterium]